MLAAMTLALAALALACSSSNDSAPPASAEDARTVPTPTPQVELASGETVITIHMSSPRADGQTGYAVVSSSGGQTTISIDLEPPRTEAQPIHIHAGVCEEVGNVVVALENVIRGQSMTVLEQSLESILVPGMLINVHESFNDFPTYTACAPLPVMDG